MKLNDLTGFRFERLTVLELAESLDRRTRWLCRCDCGRTRIINAKTLLNGGTRSCGCLRRETTAAKNTKHGLSRSSEHLAWRLMIERCKPAYKNHSVYYDLGIRVCCEWQYSDPNGFMNFFAHVGAKPTSKHSLDRIDVYRGYEPGNVRWSTQQVQVQNSRKQKCITTFTDAELLAECGRRNIDLETV